MSDVEQLPDSFLRFAQSWVLLPFFAYLFAIPGLGPGAIFVRSVISRAPLGIISYFDEVTLDDSRHETAMVVIHFVFWSLFVTGLAGRSALPLWMLRTIWVVLVVLLFMSVSGCTWHFGPGLRSSGNWH